MPPHAGGIAVVIPTLNESESIAAVVAGLPRHVVDRVIVADGGSTDDTIAQARRAGAETIEAGRGYGRACLAGAQAVDDADIIVFMDGDGAPMISTLAIPLTSSRHAIASTISPPRNGRLSKSARCSNPTERCLLWSPRPPTGSRTTSIRSGVRSAAQREKLRQDLRDAVHGINQAGEVVMTVKCVNIIARRPQS
jgi:glycosyltransferase involved in cell wall biosynthesis